MAVETVDIAIVGAGPAGLAAASELAQHGGNVVVLDEASIPGGRLPGQIHPVPGTQAGSSRQWSNGAVRAAELKDKATQAGARIICGASVWGIFSGWHVAVTPTDQNFSNAARPVGYDARAVLIATGATQNPLVMKGWTLPGVISAGAALSLINVHHVLPGHNAAVVGLDPLSLAAAQLMSEAGTNVHGIVMPPINGLQPKPSLPAEALRTLARFSDYAPSRSLALLGKIAGKLSPMAARFYPGSGVAVNGIRLFLRRAAQAVEGENRAEQIVVSGITANGGVIDRRQEIWPVDVVVTSAGLSPLVDLVQVAGSPLVHVADLGGWVPLHNQRLETPIEGLFVSGSITGVEGAEVAEAAGRLAGINAAGYLGLAASSIVEEDIRKYQAAVKSARKISLPFLPDIEKGRQQLQRCL